MNSTLSATATQAAGAAPDLAVLRALRLTIEAMQRLSDAERARVLQFVQAWARMNRSAT